jgi:hypothetical protein
MPEVAPAFVGAEAMETVAEQRPEGLDGPAAGRAGVRSRGADASDRVYVEAVRDDEVPGMEHGDENLVDAGQEAGAVNPWPRKEIRQVKGNS